MPLTYPINNQYSKGMEIIKKYFEQKGRKLQRGLFIIFSLPMSVLLQYTILTNVPKYYLNNQMNQVFWGTVCFIGFLLMEYIWIVAIIELMTVASTVELTEDKIIGYSSLGNHRWEMKYSDISLMTPKVAGWAIILKDKKANKLLISIFTHPFGDCMETIQKKAINANKVNFGRLKNNKRIWKMS